MGKTAFLASWVVLMGLGASILLVRSAASIRPGATVLVAPQNTATPLPCPQAAIELRTMTDVWKMANKEQRRGILDALLEYAAIDTESKRVAYFKPRVEFEPLFAASEVLKKAIDGYSPTLLGQSSSHD